MKFKPVAMIVTIDNRDYVVDSIHDAVWGNFSWVLTDVAKSDYVMNYDPMYLTKFYVNKIRREIAHSVMNLYKSNDHFKMYLMDNGGILHEV